MKKLLTLVLSLTLALSLSVPALAVEDDLLISPAPEEGWEDVYEPTDYDLGWEAGFNAVYEEWYAIGSADGQKGTPNPPADGEYTWGETYEDGYADGMINGKDSGYADGYYDAAGRGYWSDLEIVDKGGVPGQVNVMFNGQCVSFLDAVPKIVHDRTMIPVRAVMETMDAQVDYDKAGRVVLITKEDTTVSFVIGSPTMTITKDGDEVTTEEMDCAPYIENSRTMVPLRFLSQAFGYTVLWDSDYRTAVVVDGEALIAEMDSKFTHLNQFLASQQASQAGKKLQETGSLSASFTHWDVDGAGTEVTLPFSAAYNAYTDGQSCRVELSFNLKDTLTALEKACPGLLEEMEVDLSTALNTDLTAIPATLLLTAEGQMYLQMPLLNTLMLGSTADTWLSLGNTGVALGQTSTLTIGQAMVPSLLTDDGSFQLQDTLDLTISALEAIFGDQVAKVDRSSTTWTMDAKALAASMGLDLTEEDAALLDDFSLVTTMNKNGSYTMTSSLDYADEYTSIAFALDASGSTRGSNLTMTMAMDQIFALDLTAATTIKTISALPSMTLPEGAIVEDLAV